MDDRLANRAAVFAAVGEPVRLAMVDRLVLEDLSPGELAAELNLGTNLLAHHLKVLEEAGVIRRTRSEGDRRRSYVHLCDDDETVRAVTRSQVGSAKLPAIIDHVLFVCTANSARSQMAAATWNSLSSIPAASAGTHPARRVHPRAVEVARRHGLGLQDPPADVHDALRSDQLVVAVCDNAHEELGSDVSRIHWSVPDPVRQDSPSSFEDAFARIHDRVRHLATVQVDNPKAS